MQERTSEKITSKRGFTRRQSFAEWMIDGASAATAIYSITKSVKASQTPPTVTLDRIGGQPIYLYGTNQSVSIDIPNPSRGYHQLKAAIGLTTSLLIKTSGFNLLKSLVRI